MKLAKFLAVIIVIIISVTYLLPTNVQARSQTISTDINKIDDKKYPGIKSMIQTLQKQHPNWNFKVLYTGLDWDTVIKNEAKHGRNLIGANQKNYSGDWICSTCGNKGYSGGSWRCTSSAAIEYMMDPRNSLYYADVFQFLELSYDSKVEYSSDIIKKILKDTFMDDGNLNKYISTILNTCKEKNVNPYFVAVKIIQEQGTSGGSTVKMKDGNEYYYNIFNINATGRTVSDIIENALSWAKSKGWNTVEKCLVGGIEFMANGYITIGQDTMYLEKFDVVGDSCYTHQYAQDVMYAQNQGTRFRKILEKINATEFSYTFVIPLYDDMPKMACSRPSSTSTPAKPTPTPTPEPTPTPTPTPTPETNPNNKENNTTGDLTEDEKIDSADLLFLRKYLLGKINFTDNQKANADTNGDGLIDSADLLNIRKYLLGKIKSF